MELAWSSPGGMAAEDGRRRRRRSGLRIRNLATPTPEGGEKEKIMEKNQKARRLPFAESTPSSVICESREQ